MHRHVSLYGVLPYPCVVVFGFARATITSSDQLSAIELL